MKTLKALVTQVVVAVAIVTSFTVMAQAQPVQNDAPVSITVASSVSAVGVLSQN